MKVLFKLALRNLMGAGLRTWLNVIVLSLTFVVIIAGQGLFRGMGDQAARSSIEAEYGGGQFWHSAYDPYNPLTIQEAHGIIPPQLRSLITAGQATPILIIQGTLYPHGRFLPVLIKGIDPGQNILQLPSEVLRASISRHSELEVKAEEQNKKIRNHSESLSIQNSTTAFLAADAAIPDEIPAFIGSRMAAAARLSSGDAVILRWRNARGAFDARLIRIAHVFRTIVQSVDTGQVWIPLHYLQAMAGLPGEATIITLAPGVTPPSVPSASENNLLKRKTSIRSDVLPDSTSGEDISVGSAHFKASPGNIAEKNSSPATGFTVSQSTLNSPLFPFSLPTSYQTVDGWVYRDLRFLLRDIDQLVVAKTAGSAMVYAILLFMSLLAIFDTQVLNIFYRLKEIGTLVALGLTRRQIVLLFTLEGTLHAVLAALLAAIYGYPLLSAFGRSGWKMPESFDRFGIALGERLVPVFTGGIIIGTVILVMSLTAVISFMPARKLSRLRPTDALRGKM